MFLVSKLLYICGIVIIIMQKGIADAVSLILVLQYTTETWWIFSFNESYMSMHRNMLSA